MSETSRSFAAPLLPVPRLSAAVDALPATIPFVGPEALERQRGVSLRLRIGANESLFGPAPSVVARVAETLFDSRFYGDPEAWTLRQALAARHGVSPENIVIAGGIDELLGLFVRAYVDPGAPVVMSTGGYPTFAYHVAGFGGRFVTVPYRDDHNDGLALVEAARRSGARLLYLANPDNPTGTWLPPETIAEMAARLPENCLFLLDEAYTEFAPPETQPVLAADPRIVRLRTFSKAHGLAGLRIGYAVGEAATVRALDRIRNHFGVARPAQEAALAALDAQDHLDFVRRENAEGRADYAALARELGWTALPSATNFVAIDVGGRERARRILDRLLTEEGIFIRMPGQPPLDRCIRVTVAPRAERLVFAEALRRIAATL